MRFHIAWLRCFSLAVLCLIGHVAAHGPSWRVEKKEEVREVCFLCSISRDAFVDIIDV
jgi:hypothetical protein